MVKSVADLYALPEQSAEFRTLQKSVNEILTGGVQYSSPMYGSNQQPIQMADFDGDGQDEAIVFTVSVGGEFPLKAFVFDKVGDEFVNICAIEGAGHTFDHVEYAQMDGRGGSEIIIGRQIANQSVRAIGVYSIEDGRPVEHFTANYSEFTITDLDGDGNRDLFLLRFLGDARTGTAELFRCKNGTMERETELPVSFGAQELRRINNGRLSKDLYGVFVGGIMEEYGSVTDVFCFIEGKFTRISSRETLELSAPPVRGYPVFATDVDLDGVLELPHVITLSSQLPDGQESQYSVISWYNYEAAKGLTLSTNTYHNFAAGWFLRLPSRMGTDFVVSRAAGLSGASGLIFSLNNGKNTAGEELFSLYVYTGSNRSAMLPGTGFFTVSARGETTYVARLGPAAQLVKLTQEEVSAMFNYIQVYWNSGET